MRVALIVASVVFAFSLTWIWWWWTPLPPPVDERTKNETAQASGLVLYLGLLALIEIDARQQWQDRYRRCDPEPYEWYLVERTVQLSARALEAVVWAFHDFMFRFRWCPLEWIRTEFVTDAVRVYATPYVAALQLGIDLLGEVFWGKSYYAPPYQQPLCYVYCSGLEGKCEYI